jgi:hypothetical protein
MDQLFYVWYFTSTKGLSFIWQCTFRFVHPKKYKNPGNKSGLIGRRNPGITSYPWLELFLRVYDFDGKVNHPRIGNLRRKFDSAPQ